MTHSYEEETTLPSVFPRNLQIQLDDPESERTMLRISSGASPRSPFTQKRYFCRLLMHFQHTFGKMALLSQKTSEWYQSLTAHQHQKDHTVPKQV